jgi:hypothetical protein
VEVEAGTGAFQTADCDGKCLEWMKYSCQDNQCVEVAPGTGDYDSIDCRGHCAPGLPEALARLEQWQKVALGIGGLILFILLIFGMVQLFKK